MLPILLASCSDEESLNSSDDLPATEDDGTEDAVPFDDSEVRAFYDPGRIVEIDLTIGADGREALTADAEEYVSGIVTIDGERIPGVGVRMKGDGTSHDWAAKPSFKVKFDEFDDSLRYRGLRRLTLDSMQEDAAMVREVFAYQSWGSGLAAPLANFAWVTIDGEPFGLYANVESMDGRFALRAYGDESNLWEGEAGADFSPTGSGFFELESDEGDWNLLQEAVRFVEEEGPGCSVFQTTFEPVLDVDRFLAFWAWTDLLGQWHGYPYTLDSFMVHVDVDGRMSLSPWGLDECLGGSTDAPQPVARLLAYCPPYTAFEEARAAAVEEWEAGDPVGRAQALFDLTEEAVAADPREYYGAEVVANEREALLRFLGGR